MGSTAAFILAAASPDELALTDEAQSIEAYQANQTTWTSLELDEDAFWERDHVLDDLVAETGRGALVALSLDSDFLGIVGKSPGGMTWSGVIDREAALDYRDEGLDAGYDAVVPEFAEPAAATAGAIAWAGAAGLNIDEETVRRVFDTEGWDQPREQYWWELLDAFGLKRFRS